MMCLRVASTGRQLSRTVRTKQLSGGAFGCGHACCASRGVCDIRDTLTYVCACSAVELAPEAVASTATSTASTRSDDGEVTTDDAEATEDDVVAGDVDDAPARTASSNSDNKVCVCVCVM
jgi:hypothetical protein